MLDGRVDRTSRRVQKEHEGRLRPVVKILTKEFLQEELETVVPAGFVLNLFGVNAAAKETMRIDETLTLKQLRGRFKLSFDAASRRQRDAAGTQAFRFLTRDGAAWMDTTDNDTIPKEPEEVINDKPVASRTRSKARK
jgi:hypothetical protein